MGLWGHCRVFALGLGSNLGTTVAKTSKQRLLQEAVKLMGRDKVAAELRVPLNLLDVWLRGLATMPDRKLLPLADLILGRLSDEPRKK
jgi:hypothetical protein